MSEVASAYVSLLPSASGWRSKIEKQAGGEVRSAGNRLGGMLAAGFATAAGVGALAFVTDAIGKASELEQSIGGVKAVFGEYADEVEADSKRAADALGLSASAYNELITLSGGLLKNKGLKDYAGQAERLLGIGADLAAQYGGSTREAVEALNAAMRGESEPIERYLISLNESAVQAELAAKGQAKLTGAALEQAKAQARLSIITKQSADAHGAFAREADTLSGKQQRLRANWEDISAELGTQLLPVASRAAEVVSDFVEGMQDGTGAGGDFVDMLRDARDVGAGMVDFVKSIPGPVLKFGAEAAVAALAVSKLSSGLGALGRMRADMASTASGAGALQRGLAGLGSGARALAGAGGMTLLANSLDDADTGMGALKTTAGAAALGFSLGGPWGGAIGAVGGLGTALWKTVAASDEAKGAYGRLDDLMKQLKQSSTDYAATIDQKTGAATRETRQLALQRLEQAGLLKVTREAGITDRQVIQGITGNLAARERLAGSLAHLGRLTDQQTDALLQESAAIDSSREKQLRANIVTAETKEQVRLAKEEYARFQRRIAGGLAVKVDDKKARQTLSSFAAFWNETIGGLAQPGPVPQAGGISAVLGQTTQRAIVPPASDTAAIDSGQRRVIVVIGGREFEGYMSEVADDRIAANGSLLTQSGRAL